MSIQYLSKQSLILTRIDKRDNEKEEFNLKVRPNRLELNHSKTLRCAREKGRD